MVLEMALLDEAMDYVDVVCETGLTVDMLHALAYRGAAFAEAALTRWMMEGLRTLYSDGALESEWLAVLASSSDVMTFYPYIAHLGPLLYKRCTERTFELLFPTHPGADHYLARKARCLGDREGDPDRDAVAYVRGLVARGIDRHRAMGVALGPTHRRGAADAGAGLRRKPWAEPSKHCAGQRVYTEARSVHPK